jgi:hypothetical protein
MKAIKIALVMILVVNGSFSLYNWMFNEESKPALQQNVQMLPEPNMAAADGFDLRSLTSMVKEVRSGQELERKLNEKGGINNIDLDGNGKTDYIFVREFGDVKDKIGYSMTVEPVKGEIQEIATAEVEKNGDRAEIQVVGNDQIYGQEAIYNDWTQIEREKLPEQSGSKSAPMYHSYFYPRPLWISPFFFGFYPPYYSFFPIVGRTSYMTQTNRYRSPGVQSGRNSYQRSSKNQIQSPNKGKSANRGITRSLKKPTSTQKQFQATRNRNVKSGGFGRGTASASSRSGSANRSSRTRSFSSRSSGSGSSSSLSTRSSSFRKSSFRSSSFGSRSFGFGK